MTFRPIPGRAPSPRDAAEHGFTLVEALVALTVLGLALSVVVQLSALTLRTQVATARHLDAAVLADARMQQLTLLEDDSLPMYANGRWGEVLLAPNRYRWRATVSPVPGAPGLWRAAVRIAWTGGDLNVETAWYRPAGVARRGE